jgi:predicted Zn-dependent protease with MMP-like domain
MKDIAGPPLRAAALTAFFVGLALVLLRPPSLEGLRSLLIILVGAAAFVFVAAWLTVVLSGDDIPADEFGRLVERSEALATLPPPDVPPSGFDLLVMQALDNLPEEFHQALAHTPVVVSNHGREHRAYGYYIGGTIGRPDTFPDRIVIYQDTLERDFGHDPELLRAQVERTVRHELGHHLGFDEHGVRRLGL